MVFGVGDKAGDLRIAARAEPAGRDARQVAGAILQLGAYVIAEDRRAEIGREALVDLAVEADEAGIARDIADQAEILEPVGRAGKDIAVEILVVDVQREVRVAGGLAEGGVDRLRGFLAQRRRAQLIAVVARWTPRANNSCAVGARCDRASDSTAE
jgi:hypothetical protein